MLIWKSLATALGALALAIGTGAVAQQSAEGDTAAADGVEPPESASQMNPAGFSEIMQQNAEATLGQQVVDEQGTPLGEAVAVAKDDEDNIVLVVEDYGERYAIPAEDVQPNQPNAIASSEQMEPFDMARHETLAEAGGEDLDTPAPAG